MEWKGVRDFDSLPAKPSANRTPISISELHLGCATRFRYSVREKKSLTLPQSFDLKAEGTTGALPVDVPGSC
jgi:hypothetical protein